MRGFFRGGGGGCRVYFSGGQRCNEDIEIICCCFLKA